jgi:hypothetical protein
MKNSAKCRRRIYAPRGTVKTKRVPIGIDPVLLTVYKTLDNAQSKTDAAYVLEVYLEGQAIRRRYRPATGSVEAK